MGRWRLTNYIPLTLSLVLGAGFSGCLGADKMTLKSLGGTTKVVTTTSTSLPATSDHMIVKAPVDGGDPAVASTANYKISKVSLGGNVDPTSGLANSSGTNYKMKGGLNGAL